MYITEKVLISLTYKKHIKIKEKDKNPIKSGHETYTISIYIHKLYNP